MPATFTRTPVETERKDPGFGGKPPVARRPTGGGGDGENWDNRPSGRRGPRDLLGRYRMVLFFALASDLMFFIALVSAFFARQSSGHFTPNNTWVIDWRPVAVPPILWINTALILLSSLTMEIGRRHFFREIDVMEEWLGLGRPTIRRAAPWLTATVLLATLGLHGLAGLVLLTPVAAMLLAAPGSAHPHDGPLDWLTPLVIQAGQYAYLAALGFAKGVPGPLVFALIGLVAVRQLDAAYRARYPMPAGEPRGGIGWEGRMLAAGAGAMLGVGPLTYLALTVYLLWLVSSGSLASWLAIRAQSRGVRRPSLGS